MKFIHKFTAFYILTVFFILSFFRVDGQFNMNWQKNFGGNSTDVAYSVEISIDSSLYAVGLSYSVDTAVTCSHGGGDFWLIKLDSLGNKHWQECYGGAGFESGQIITESFEGGFIIGGQSWSNNGDVSGNHGYGDFWIINIDTTGSMNWQKCFGGSQEEFPFAIVKTSDSCYVIGGFTGSYDGDVNFNYGVHDWWMIKIDLDGNIIWENSYGGSDLDGMRSLQTTFDNGFIACGYTYSDDFLVSGNHGSSDIWTVKFDSLGNVQWKNCYGGMFDEIGNSIIQTPDSSYLVFGDTGSNDGDISGNHGSHDLVLLKLDSAGNIIWQKCYGGTSSEESNKMISIDNGNYLLLGSTFSDDGDVSGNNGDMDAWIVEVDSLGAMVNQLCLGGSERDQLNGLITYRHESHVLVGAIKSNDSGLPNTNVVDYWVVNLMADSTVGFIENSNSMNYRIFPNPVKSFIEIEMPDLVKDFYKIRILNVFGQVVKPLFEGNGSTIYHNGKYDVSDLSDGIYFLEIQSFHNNFVYKIIKN